MKEKDTDLFFKIFALVLVFIILIVLVYPYSPKAPAGYGYPDCTGYEAEIITLPYYRQEDNSRTIQLPIDRYTDLGRLELLNRRP